jgi:inner membrane transporter RhtA
MAYALDQMALRRVSARAFSAMMSLHPAVAAIVGFLVLEQGLSRQTVVALALVIVASIAVGRCERPEPA